MNKTKEQIEILSEDVNGAFTSYLYSATHLAESVLNEGANNIISLSEGVKSKLKKAWEKIVEFFQAVINKFNDIFKGTSEKLNMNVSRVDNGTYAEIKAGTKTLLKRTIGDNEKVFLLDISIVGPGLKLIGESIEKSAFEESTHSVFESDFFNENDSYYDSDQVSRVISTSKEIVEKEASEIKRLEDHVWQYLNDAKQIVTGKDYNDFQVAAAALNKYSGKLLSATRSISQKTIKRAKKEPGQHTLRKYRILKDAVNVIASFKSYIQDVD